MSGMDQGEYLFHNPIDLLFTYGFLRVSDTQFLPISHVHGVQVEQRTLDTDCLYVNVFGPGQTYYFKVPGKTKEEILRMFDLLNE